MKPMIKKVLSLGLVAAVTASIAVGGTMAYLTDRDSEANVFTSGNVEIELNEEFQQGAELIPGVKIEKKATITNTGDNDAWVWMTLAVPTALDDATVGTVGVNNVLHWNVPGCFWEGYHNNQTYIDSGIAAGYLPAGSTGVTLEDTWNVDDRVAVQTDVDINGVMYNVYTFLYNGAIVPGETTSIALHQVYIDTAVDIDTNGDWYLVKNGVAEKINWNSNTNGNPIVYVSAYAMQKDQFDTVDAAYKAYNAQWTTTEGENKGLEYGAPATLVATASELSAALAAGDDVALTKQFDLEEQVVLNGQTINGSDYEIGTAAVDVDSDCVFTVTGGATIENMTIKGDAESTRAIGSGSSGTYSLTGDLYIDNVTIDSVQYAINGSGSSDANVYVTDSTIYGWCSYSGINSFNFSNCTLGMGNSYDGYLSVYGTTNFTDCNFEGVFDMGARNDDQGVVYAAGKTITFTNCTYDGVKVTADNFVDYFYYGSGDERDFGNLMRECTIIVDGVKVDNSNYIN